MLNRKLLYPAFLICFSVTYTAAFTQGTIVPNPGPGGFNANGTLSIGGATNLEMGISFGTNNSIFGAQTFAKDFDQYSFRPIVSSGRLFAYGTEQNIKGNRFLFDKWVKGTVVKNSGEEISGDKYYFNFDKVTDNLLVTIDKKEIIEVYKDSIQAFSFHENGEFYRFKKLIPIQRYRFVQVLLEDGAKYSLYKTINTRFVAADYNTNGLTESGNPYDEYVDRNQYFIMYKDEVRPVQLKFTSIKKALKENSSEVKDFYADHLMDEVNENYLTGIVEYLNK
jgi:hypothetical protein